MDRDSNVDELAGIGLRIFRIGWFLAKLWIGLMILLAIFLVVILESQSSKPPPCQIVNAKMVCSNKTPANE